MIPYRLPYGLPLGLFIALVVLFIVGLQNDPSRVPSPLIDKPIPGFSLPTLKDATTSIHSQALRGKVSLLNIWASWCLSCRHEHPLLVKLAQQNIVDIYGLNYKDDRAAALKWLDELGNPYLMSAFDAQGTVGIDFGVYGVPETYVIDINGIIRYKHIGPITKKDLDEKILPLIKRLRKPLT